MATLNAELVDWNVGVGEVDDAPDKHWPLRVSLDQTDICYDGNMMAKAIRPDGSQLEVVLEVDDGKLAIRVYATDAQGVDMNEGGEPLVNLSIHADNTVENV